MQARPLLDIIDTDRRMYVGVVDYVNAKYVSFFDISQLEDPDLTHLVVLYKMYYSDIRFSVFVATHAPHFNFGNPININKKLIRYHSKPLKPTTPPRKVVCVKVK